MAVLQKNGFAQFVAMLYIFNLRTGQNGFCKTAIA